MDILVTGATGFVGSAVTRKLLARGDRVRVLVRPSSNLKNLWGLNVDYVTGDIRDQGAVVQAVRNMHQVYHVAADYRLWVRSSDDLYQLCKSNITGTRNVLTAAAAEGVDRIVHTSSVCTLGLTDNEKFDDEETPVCFADMIGPYKKSKFRAEQIAKQLAARGAPIVIVNPSTPIGPRDIKPTPTGRVILEAALGRMPAYVNTGLNLVHVDDVAAGHLLAAARGRFGERYVLGGQNMSLKVILNAIAVLTGRRPPLTRLPRRALFPLAYLVELVARISNRNEPLLTVDGLKLAEKHMFFSSRKAEHELGFRAGPALHALCDAIVGFGIPISTDWIEDRQPQNTLSGRFARTA